MLGGGYAPGVASTGPSMTGVAEEDPIGVAPGVAGTGVAGIGVGASDGGEKASGDGVGVGETSKSDDTDIDALTSSSRCWTAFSCAAWYCV